MSSTSQKHKNFVSEPMGEKEVTELAGIGNVLGERFTEKGFDKVCYLFSVINLICTFIFRASLVTGSCMVALCCASYLIHTNIFHH